MYKKSSSVTERILAVCLVWFLPLAILLACGTASKKTGDAAPAVSTPGLVKSEKFDVNGEMAAAVTAVSSSSSSSDEPASIRDRFEHMFRDRREVLERSFRTQRDAFNAEAKIKRDRALSDLEAARSKFVNGSGRKADSKTRSAFAVGQDRDRQALFAAENARRHDFEDQLREARRVMDNDARDLESRFGVEYRATVARRAAEKASATPTPEAAANHELIQEFQKIPKGPSTPLGPGVE